MNKHIQRLLKRDFTVRIAPAEFHHTSPIPPKGSFNNA